MEEYTLESEFLFNINDEDLAKRNLIKKNKDDCLLFKYERNQDLENIDDIRECRGIIIQNEKFLCLPPIKNLDQNTFLQKYKFNESQIEEFIDGTMVNIYWNNNQINFSTRSQVDANDKNYGILNRSFKDMFNEVYGEYNFKLEENLGKDICLSCVLCHIDNPIVKIHKENKIYLVEAKKILNNNKYNVIDIHNSEELKNILFERPKIYDFKSIEKINEYLDKQNFEFKGFILKNKNHKTKIENIKYLNIKNLRRLDIKNTKILYYTLKQNNQMKKFLNLFPNYSSKFDEYKKEYENLIEFLYINYRKRWVVKKEDRISSISELKYECRPIIHELHKQYLNDKKIITKDIINNYIINLPIHSLFHTLKALE